MQAWKVMLCAVFVSAGAAAQTAPRPPAPPSPMGGDFLRASNEAKTAVRVEFFAGNAPPIEGARPQMSFCVGPQATAYWPINARNPNGLLRMHVLRAAECRGPGSREVACRSEAPRGPKLQHVALRADGNNCAITPVAVPAGMLRADNPCGPSGAWAPITIENKSRHGLWVTFYDREPGWNPADIYAAACWMPGEKRMACIVRSGQLSLRGEAVNNRPTTASAGSCSEQLYYDTQAMGQNLSVDLRRNASRDTTFHCYRTTYGMGCNFD